MVFDQSTSMYVPCVYTFLTGKIKNIYCILFCEIKVLFEYNRMHYIITTDFEKSLVAAVKQEFPDSHILGCFFDLKQTKNLILTKKEILKMICEIKLSKSNFLTFIPSSDIDNTSLYVKKLLNYEDKNMDFFELFRTNVVENFSYFKLE